MKAAALFLLCFFCCYALAAKVESANDGVSVTRPRRLRRFDQQHHVFIDKDQAKYDEKSHQRSLFGAGLVAKWVQEAKQDFDEISEVLNKALDDETSMPAKPTMSPTPLPCGGMSDAERDRQIRNRLSFVSEMISFVVPYSPQSQSMKWLIEDDAYYVCPDDPQLVQRYVMAVFYYSSRGDDWTQCSAPDDLSDRASIATANAKCNLEVDRGGGGTDAWLTPVSECNWGGLKCHEDSQSLERIDFERNNLQGTLPLEIAELAELRFLHLEEGKTAGRIPSALGKLSALEELDLNFNLFVGSIPDALFNLENLIELDLNDNLLQGSISSNIGKLKKLGFLQLSRNSLTGTIPTEIGQLTALVIANFDRNQMTGEMPAEMCDLRDTEGGQIASLTCDCLDRNAKFYVACKTPECCTQCFEPSAP